MENIFNILKIILPAITTGIFTFFITKYTYNKNRPLDKLEIAYNKVYYPLYKLIHYNDYSKDIDILINKAKHYFKIYDKYIDRSTIKAFNYLCEGHESERRVAYKNFENNIYNRNSYLRRRLGYLEPNLLQIYKYLSSSDKSNFRIVIWLMLLCIFLMIMIAFANYSLQCITDVLCIIVVIIFLAIMAEIIFKLAIIIYYKIKNYCKKE